MESLRQQIAFVFRLAVGMAFFSVVWFLVQAIFPQFSPAYLWKSVTGNHATSTKSAWNMDWLPTPRLVSQAKSPSATTNVYVPGPAYQHKDTQYYNSNSGGMAVDYVMYTATGSYIVRSPQQVTKQETVQAGAGAVTQQTSVGVPAQTPGSPVTRVLSGDRSLYIRNLSIAEYGQLRKNTTFVGEARNTFFKDGKFPLVLMDVQGKTGLVGYAQATTDWTIAGWTRFQATIQTSLPDNSTCNMFFQSANVVAPNTRPASVPITMTCVR